MRFSEAIKILKVLGNGTNQLTIPTLGGHSQIRLTVLEDSLKVNHWTVNSEIWDAMYQRWEELKKRGSENTT